MVTLKGIIQYRDKGVTKTEIVVTVDRGDNYKYTEFNEHVPVNAGTIRAEAARAFGGKPGDMIWPPHIEVQKM